MAHHVKHWSIKEIILIILAFSILGIVIYHPEWFVSNDSKYKPCIQEVK